MDVQEGLEHSVEKDTSNEIIEVDISSSKSESEGIDNQTRKSSSMRKAVVRVALFPFLP